MTHIITQPCCNDAACVPVCPVNCIHPTPDEPDFATAEMLYIDPEGCVDCGVCVDVCPVNAIVPDYQLPDESLKFADLNALYYADPAHQGYDDLPQEQLVRGYEGGLAAGPLRVAVVGSGPAAFYAAEELLSLRGLSVEVAMFERLPMPYGLVRYGVAPDHESTKEASTAFGTTLRRPNFRLHLNVEIGSDLTHADLLEYHHAVIYAVGASADRALGIPGEQLPGSHPASDFVAWYNGHPDFSDREFDFSGDRAVIVGNGNVALDVARVLTRPIDDLARTDIAAHALEQLAESKLSEVVVLGRRGPAQAAFTTAELLGLEKLRGVDLVIDRDVLDFETSSYSDPETDLAVHKVRMMQEIGSERGAGGRRIVLRFLASPVQVLGEDRVTGLRVQRNTLSSDHGRVLAVPTGEYDDLDCDLLFRSVGYRGVGVPGLPLDDAGGVIPSVAGRVTDPHHGGSLAGAYVTGWIKRGPTGVIGSNRRCARETVESLVADFGTGDLPSPTGALEQLAERLAAGGALDDSAWRRIDEYEKALGREAQRPRIKLTSTSQMLQVARSEGPT